MVDRRQRHNKKEETPREPAEISQLGLLMQEHKCNPRPDSFVAIFDKIATFKEAVAHIKEAKRYPPKFNTDFVFMVKRALEIVKILQDSEVTVDLSKSIYTTLFNKSKSASEFVFDFSMAFLVECSSDPSAPNYIMKVVVKELGERVEKK